MPPPASRSLSHISFPRRSFLRVGALGSLLSSLPALLRADDVASPNRTPRARSVIFLHQFGGASHLDTFDMKPAATARIRGEFNPIRSNLPGLSVCEHLPCLAHVMDRACLIRSMCHRTSNHNPAAYYSLTGHKPLTDIVTANASATDVPAYGSVVDHLAPSKSSVPTAVSLPWMIADGPFRTPGEFAGFLGKQHDPLFVTRDPNKPDFRVEELVLPIDIPLNRALDRDSILQRLSGHARLANSLDTVRGMSAYQSRALSLITSPQTQRAFDIHREDPRLRDRYGRTAYGQSTLLARRLVEAGVRFVTVFYSPGIGGWDTHENNFSTLKGSRLPITDQVVSALVEDLDSRGLLDETLVVWTGEFGRTPRINKNAGRDHWPQCYTVLLFGGGLKRGYIHGASDASGAYPKESPCSPDDLSATMFALLGIDPATELHDQLARPVPVSYGTPIRPLFV
jgi:hypothetical protein